MSSLLPLVSRRAVRPALASVTLGFAAFGSLALAPPASAQYYNAVNLASLGLTSYYGTINGGINNAGQIADGNLLTGPGGLGPVITIGTLNGHTIIASCVNDAGEVAGRVNVGFEPHVVVSGSQGTGPLKDLGSLGSVGVTDINASGQVYGQYTLNGHSSGFLSEPGEGDALKTLGLVPGFEDIVTAKVNDSGQVTGTASNGFSDFNRHAFISGMDGNGPLRDLGTLGGNFSYGADINASGQVVGSSNLSFNSLGNHAFLSGPNGGPLQDLGSLIGSEGYSDASGVNDAGQVVGDSDVSLDVSLGAHAFLYSAGVMTDLNNLTTISPGYVLDNASQITNSGFILATGYSINAFGERQDSAFLLTPTSTPPPVPEASTTVSFGLLLALGLGGVIIAKRKKARAAV